jgi:hypothetical protein
VRRVRITSLTLLRKLFYKRLRTIIPQEGFNNVLDMKEEDVKDLELTEISETAVVVVMAQA